MEKNVLFVVNPVSGDLDKSQLIEARVFREQQIHFELYETTGKMTLNASKRCMNNTNPNVSSCRR
jgi:hypothetical protein